MKRISIFILLIIFSLCAVSCSFQQASDKALTCGNIAVETAEKYLSHELDYSEASDEMDRIVGDMSYTSEMSEDDEYYHADRNISIYISLLSYSLFADYRDNSLDAYDSLKESIKNLKDTIEQYD